MLRMIESLREEKGDEGFFFCANHSTRCARHRSCLSIARTTSVCRRLRAKLMGRMFSSPLKVVRETLTLASGLGVASVPLAVADATDGEKELDDG